MLRASMLALAVALPAGCGNDTPAGWSGYGESDYVYVSSPVPGRLATLAVQAGQDVARGALLFALDTDAEQATRAAEAARLAQAQAQAADTAKGRRADEIAVIQAQLAQARHRRYNPEGLSRLNIVPGLVGVILTMTMVMLTGLATTRERERGTMENLLATPVRPLEVMIGRSRRTC
jgi:ABC-type Na+ efflux pump permease subunit